MLAIREIKIDGKADNRTDHLQPELAFALESDVPGTSLADATVTVCGQTFDCGNNQTGFPLKGLALQPFAEYPLEIWARDNHGQEAAVAASFRTGRLKLPWEASWITDKDYTFGKKQSPVPMTFRKCFIIQKSIRRAYITATAIGIYELKLNGKKVGDRYFAPGFTSYKRNLQYQFYDVTEQLVCSNTLIAVVAGGWAVGRFTYENKNKITAPRQALLLELIMEYTDGTAERVVTDNSWEVTRQGNYRKACLYDGETYDASVDLEAVSWKHADATRLPFHPEIALENSRVICREILHPVSHFENSDGEIIYDFGQNFAGVVELRIWGKAGQVITIHHAEVLEGDRLYTASLRTAKAEIRYICKEGAQTYSPRLTYMGFRYIAVTGIAPEALEVKARVLSSDFEESGDFSCSNARLNQLQSNIRWSALSNFVDIPTDCPQRDERQGWTGDIAVFASTACYNFGLSRFLEKWLKDMRIEQGRGGGIPTVIPIQGCSTPVVAVACWGDSCILVPWAEYLTRGNTELLRRQYPCMKRYLKAVKFWASLSGFGQKKYIWKWLFQFGDWCAPEGYIKDWMAKGKWVATAYFANSCGLMAKIAAVLGETQDMIFYTDLREKICQAFRSILTDGSGNLLKDFQTGYVLLLYFDMEQGENRKTMAANLNRLVAEKDYHLSTGFTGTPYLLFALADNGYADTAYRVLMQDTCPSWLYCVKMGATTFWEQWNAITPDGKVRDPSMNHYAYGAVGDFLYRRVLGLEPLEGGCRYFRVKPVLGGGLSWAEGFTGTPYGKIQVRWDIQNGIFSVTVNVPVSTTCQLVLPSGKEFELHSGVHHINEPLEKE